MRYEKLSAEEEKLKKELLKKDDEIRKMRAEKTVVKEVVKEVAKPAAPEEPQPIKIKKPSNAKEYWALKKQASAMGIEVPKKIKTDELRTLIDENMEKLKEKVNDNSGDGGDPSF